MKHTVARIIPLLRVPRGLEEFDYLVPEDMGELTAGAVVRIPWRTSTLDGVVVRTRTLAHIPKKTKTILSVVADRVLPAHVLPFARALAESTFAPLPLILRSFVASTVKKEPPLPSPSPLIGSSKESVRVPGASVASIRRVLARKRGSIYHWHRNDERLAVMLKEIERAHSSGTVLVLMPDRESIDAFLPSLPVRFAPSVTIVTSGGSVREQAAQWRGIADGTFTIVIGTRRALFMPFPKLSAIILDGEERYGWREEQNPRIDARQAAVALARCTRARLIRLTPSPRIATIALERTAIITSPPPPTTPITIVNLRDEAKGSPSFYCSIPLIEQLEQLSPQDTAILFLNRRGFATFVSCEDCKLTMMCPRCVLPLTHHKRIVDNDPRDPPSPRNPRSADELRCHHCRHIEPFFLTCPKCHGPNLRSSGKGLERIASDITNLIGSRPQIQFATYHALARIITQPKPPAFIGVIDALSTLAVPDFHALEQTWHFLYTGTSFARAQRIPMVIQSLATEHPIFQALAEHRPELFYALELRERQSLHYPPFARFVALYVRGKTEREADDAAQALAQSLIAAWQSDTIKNDVTIIAQERVPGPVARARLLVRIPTTLSLQHAFHSIPSNVILDSDPEN